MKIVQRLKEKNRWMLLCISILTAAAITISLILLYTPREESPPENGKTAADTAVTASPRPAAPTKPPATATPVITPPAQNAVSGSDVILQHVPRTTESDLSGGPGLASKAGPAVDT